MLIGVKDIFSHNFYFLSSALQSSRHLVDLHKYLLNKNEGFETIKVSSSLKILYQLAISV